MSVYRLMQFPRQTTISPVTSLIRAHYHGVRMTSGLNKQLDVGQATSIGPRAGSSRTKHSRFKSHSMICPSAEADRSALNDRDTASTVTGVRCPNSEPVGCRSTDLLVDVNVHAETVQSVPDVISVRESAKIALDSWPICRCSK